MTKRTMEDRANNSTSNGTIAAALRSLQPAEESQQQTMQVQAVPMPWERENKFATIVHSVLTEDECKAIIQICEEGNGFEQALLNIGDYRQVLATSVRKSESCVVDDIQAAQLLWQRIQQAAPQTIMHGGKSWHSVGLNERFRVLKYKPGDYFMSHTDGIFVRPHDAGHEQGGEEGDISYFTVMLYLNTPKKGGGIDFTSRTDSTQVSHVKPCTGQVLIFDHSLRHTGVMVEEGVKYAIRTDVMYRCSEHLETDRDTATSVFIPTKSRPHGYMMKC